MNAFTFMLACVQTQFKGYSLEIEQQVKQHEARTINKLSNVHFFFFFFLNLYSIFDSYPLIQNR